jgi:hypothetical protein
VFAIPAVHTVLFGHHPHAGQFIGTDRCEGIAQRHCGRSLGIVGIHEVFRVAVGPAEKHLILKVFG